MRYLLLNFFVFFALFFLVGFLEGGKEENFEQAQLEEILPDAFAEHDIDAVDSQYNKVKLTNSKIEVYERSINQMISKEDPDYFNSSRSWFYQNQGVFVISAVGLDEQHHFASHFLVGYEPFKTENLWQPFYVLSKRKKYQLDHITYPGKKEVWQTSEEAFKFTRGDCEDHAIALADWLIAGGHDARVVLGKHKNNGHAWVILIKNDKTYLLEATDKSITRKIRSFPLADFETDYRPKYMFNRTYFWVNEGSTFTTNYTDKKWIKKSRFTRVENA